MKSYFGFILSLGLWAIALLIIMAKGGGRLSVDHLIGKKYL